MMSRRAARGQKLPPQEVEYLNSLPKDLMIFRVKLLFDEGWPLDAIGESFPQTRTRSTIRSWVVRAGETLDLDAESVFIDAPTPTPRLKTSDDGYQKVKPESPKIRLNDLEQIQLLAPQARTFRSRMASTSAPAVANQRLTTLCKKLYQDKVGIKDLAEAAGVTYRAMYKRIKL